MILAKACPACASAAGTGEAEPKDLNLRKDNSLSHYSELPKFHKNRAIVTDKW